MARPPANDSDSYQDYDDELMTGEAVALDLRPASFVLRAAGAAIDFIVYFGGLIAIEIGLIAIVANLRLDQATFTALSVVALVVCIVGIPTTVETLSQGKSLGKLAVGARIVRDDGGSIGLRHAAIRALVGVLEIFGTLGGLAVLVSLLNARSKRLGDMLAGTYSQNERVSTKVPPVFGVPLDLAEWSKTADVARMPDALARRIAHFIAQAPSLTPPTRDRLGRELATEASIYVSPIPRVQAELFLAAVVTMRREREFAALQLEKRGLERLEPALEGLPHGFPDR